MLLRLWILTLLAIAPTLTADAELPKKKIIYIIPGHWDNLLDPSRVDLARQTGYNLQPLLSWKAAAEEMGYELRVADSNADRLMDRTGRAVEAVDGIIVFDVFSHQGKYLAQYPREKIACILWEPPSVMPQNYHLPNHAHFFRVYTWCDDLVDQKRYHKLFYPALHPMVNDARPFNEKKLCALIAMSRASDHPNQLYTERFKLISFFEWTHPRDFDVYGREWPPHYSVYRGLSPNKRETLKGYRFCFAYENIGGVPGYVTEKIFDCFEAGCVPIYLGAPNIEDYIPKSCFIARADFASDEQLYQFIKGMDEARYLQYIENIRAFLGSEAAKRYSEAHFVTTMMELLQALH